MRLVSVIRKSLKEQVRSFWILILTITMAPFFVLVYNLIYESTKPHYDILILNRDRGVSSSYVNINHGEYLIEALSRAEIDTQDIPLSTVRVNNRDDAENQLKNKRADALIVIPEQFSEQIEQLRLNADSGAVDIELRGDLTDVNYMIGAVWASEIVSNYIHLATVIRSPIKFNETSLGFSGEINEFDLYVPGLLILSIIMLMFSATIAIVVEPELKTIQRLKLSRLTAFEFLTGVSFVQVLIGIICVVLTLLTAMGLGFEVKGSFAILFLVAVLTSVSIIAFSLILAAVTKTVNEVLVIGNFPLFLFMFFSGAMFPMKGKVLFTLAGYDITVQGLMSPSHAVPALKKALVLEMGLRDIIPEIVAIIVTTIIYFIIGVWAFQRKHMRIE